MSLSILCVTKGEPHARPFVWALGQLARDLNAEPVILRDGYTVKSKGYIESVLDEAISYCSGDYVLRLDDDERCSPAMVEWLKSGAYRMADHWKFSRANLWQADDKVAVTPHLWRDHQTRLSVRSKAGGRQTIHAGSPFGGGEEAPCAIEHHAFLVRSLVERRRKVARYDAIAPGAGSSFLPFICPEDAYPQGVPVVPLGDGSVAWIESQRVAA